MRASAVYAAFAAVLVSSAMAIPMPAPAALALPASHIVERQLLGGLLGGWLWNPFRQIRADAMYRQRRWQQRQQL